MLDVRSLFVAMCVACVAFLLLRDPIISAVLGMAACVAMFILGRLM